MNTQKYTVKANINLTFECEGSSPSDAYQKYIDNWCKNITRINSALKGIEIGDDSNIIVLDQNGNKVFDENEPIKANYNDIKYNFYISKK